jgi:tetratricopeptide (TPR) repeat protein
MSGVNLYTHRNLELRAAEYYASIRKPEDAWKSIADLEPQLNEFEHRICAKDYDNAGCVLGMIDDGYLRWWGYWILLTRMREKLQDHLVDHRLQVDNWESLGHACHHLGQIDQAIGFFARALTVAREVGDRQREETQVGNLGVAYRGLGQFGRAISFHEEALAIAREIGDRKMESRWLSDQGLAYNSLGEIQRSIQLYDKALNIAREIFDYRWEVVNIGRLGLAYHDLGQIERAIDHYMQLIAFSREAGNRRDEGVGLGWLGIAYYNLGQVQRAISFHQEALDIAREYSARNYESMWLSYLGLDHSALGQFERAMYFYEQALIFAQQVGARRCESHHRLRLSKSLMMTGRITEAHHHCTEALALNVPQTVYKAALTLGIIFLHQHNPIASVTFADAATRCLDMLDKTANFYNARYALATALVGQAVCDPRWSDATQSTALLAPALAEYRHALAITSAPGVVREVLRDLELIRDAGIEGLEPVFALLEQALNADTPATKGGSDLSTE